MKKLLAIMLSAMMIAAMTMPAMAAEETKAADATEAAEAMEEMEEAMEEAMEEVMDDADTDDMMEEPAAGEENVIQVGKLMVTVPEGWIYEVNDNAVQMAPDENGFDMVMIGSGPMEEVLEELEIEEADMDTMMDMISTMMVEQFVGGMGDESMELEVTDEIKGFNLNGMDAGIIYLTVSEDLGDGLVIGADVKMGLFAFDDQLAIVMMMNLDLGELAALFGVAEEDIPVAPVDFDLAFTKLIFSLKPVVEE